MQTRAELAYRPLTDRRYGVRSEIEWEEQKKKSESFRLLTAPANSSKNYENNIMGFWSGDFTRNSKIRNNNTSLGAHTVTLWDVASWSLISFVFLFCSITSGVSGLPLLFVFPSLLVHQEFWVGSIGFVLLPHPPALCLQLVGCLYIPVCFPSMIVGSLSAVFSILVCYTPQVCLFFWFFI